MSPELAVAESCLAHYQRGDHVLLVGGGVLHLLPHGKSLVSELTRKAGNSSDAAISALEADVLARGIEGTLLPDGVAVIDDAGWVDLVLAHKHCLSWK